MLTLLKTWFHIAFLMYKPYDHPGDQRSILVAVLAGLCSYIFAVSFHLPMGTGVLHALFDLMFSAVCLYVALSLVGKPARFSQAFAAYCGAGVILNLASVLMFDAALTPGSDLLFMVQVVYIMWGISVVAHIIRYTFDLPIWVGVLTAFAFFSVHDLLIRVLLPVE